MVVGGLRILFNAAAFSISTLVKILYKQKFVACNI